jgi:hypothetical protein
MDERESTRRYAFTLGIGVISWVTKKQPLETLLTTKEEYKATVGVVIPYPRDN